MSNDVEITNERSFNAGQSNRQRRNRRVLGAFILFFADVHLPSIINVA